MGPKGSPFTDADLYITAKYVASFPDFERVTARERWDPYHELVSEVFWIYLKAPLRLYEHPQRSAKAWTEHYRRYEHGKIRYY